MYILSEDADLDLNDIWEYIAQDDIDSAELCHSPDR
jgi:plasmid stabilization system protein ParE